MDQLVRLERNGAVAVLVIDASPVNALGAAVRGALMARVTEVAADPGIRAVVLRGEGRMFSAGADITEFGKPAVAPTLSDVIAAVESLEKPVVAALHGAVLGGGLELALGAHARVALAGATLGLPEVTLGILPGAGGTQRLPRLVGAAEALRMMLTGSPVSPTEALEHGLVDRVVETGLTEAAVAMAQDLCLRGRPVPTRDREDGLLDGAQFRAELAAARAPDETRMLAHDRIIDCVAAALNLPFDDGMRLERSAFLELVASPEAAALREAFREKRRLARAAAAAGPQSGTGCDRS